MVAGIEQMGLDDGGRSEFEMVKETTLLPPGAVAFTVAPWIFIRRGVIHSTVLPHETVHLHQQTRWGVVGALLGLLAWVVMGWPLEPATLLLALTGLVEGWVAAQLLWRFCYLCLLPVGWNPFRARWEREAYKADGLAHAEITALLRRKPYYLWWM